MRTVKGNLNDTRRHFGNRRVLSASHRRFVPQAPQCSGHLHAQPAAGMDADRLGNRYRVVMHCCPAVQGAGGVMPYESLVWLCIVVSLAFGVHAGWLMLYP